MQQVGRYRLVRRLGQGGMAEVFEAVAEAEGGVRRRVAIKRILPELASDAACARMFLDEARIASQLHHGSIVSVLDYGTVDGVPFQVLEYVDGLDLERLLRRAQERKVELSPGLCLHIVLQLAYALHSAHEARDHTGAALGIVHRDVSPSNVLVSWDGHVKLGDFGIALATNRLERTQGDGVKGKLEYMSPEQATRGHVDRRSDVFAVGCLLHRMLTGKSPLFDLSVLTRLASGQELELAPELPSDLAQVIARATRSAQTLRHASADELARALSELLPRYQNEEPTFALRTFLGKLRDEASKAPKRGALDALLDVELVLSAAANETAERSFRTETATTAAETDSVPASPATQATKPLAQGEDSPEAFDMIAAQSRAPRWPWVLGSLLGASIVIAAAASGSWGKPSSESARPAAVSLPPAQAVVPEQPKEAPPTSGGTELTGPGSLAASDTRAPAEEKNELVEKGRASRRRAEPRAPAKAVSAPPVAASAGKGTLVVAGNGAQRAEIRVDGQSLGFAPKRLELSTGNHQVELIRSDGQRIGPRTIHIDGQHTQSAPARFIVD